MSTEAPSAAERVYRETKERILSGEVGPGLLLSEGDIADRLSVSRTPVREAFLRLQAEDLLQLLPKRGALVTPVSPGEAADVVDIRIALETAAVRRLATAGDLDALLAPMADLIGQQQVHADADAVDAFAVVDELFHRTIVTASGNALAARFYVTLADRQRRMNVSVLGTQPRRMATLTTEHRALLTCIERRDVAGFETALVAHLTAMHTAARRP